MRDEFPEADMDKVIRMCIIHDLGECFTGDIPTFEKTKSDEVKEEFTYEDENITMNIGPTGISIHYTEDNKSKEVQDFLNYCDKLDDELFIEVCESFEPGELAKLEKNLDTPNYKETINTFTNKVNEISKNKLSRIYEDCEIEIKKQRKIIEDAKTKIAEFDKIMDTYTKKYSIC